MTKRKNPVWQFLASVKLAMTTLIILASTSILGTLIQQQKEPNYYIEEFGPGLAKIIQILDLPRMYNSWWFVTLLILFAANLLVCSIERLPTVWRIVRLDNLAINPQQLEKMNLTHSFNANLGMQSASKRLSEYLVAFGFRNLKKCEINSSTLLFAQKGLWSRWGVYVVHLSILIIFTGALIGNFLGFKAYVFLPEGRTTQNVYLQGSGDPVPLSFDLRCDRFEPMVFENGRLKGERSFLTVIDPVLEKTYQKSIIVNDPLTYNGITFYKANSVPMDGYFVVIRDQQTGQEQSFRVPSGQEVQWPNTDISFIIDDVKLDQNNEAENAKILFKVNSESLPEEIFIGNNKTVLINVPSGSFVISFRQLYSSLLLATKDPGIWVFYFGCILMVMGLLICFMSSHRRIWVRIEPIRKEETQILLSGSVNKHKSVFEERFQKLIGQIGEDKLFFIKTRHR